MNHVNAGNQIRNSNCPGDNGKITHFHKWINIFAHFSTIQTSFAARKTEIIRNTELLLEAIFNNDFESYV